VDEIAIVARLFAVVARVGCRATQISQRRPLLRRR
jgi:hypothetical protein